MYDGKLILVQTFEIFLTMITPDETPLNPDVVTNTEDLVQETEILENDPRDAELADLKDKYLRLMAEFDNYRKRTIREKSELIKTASEDVIKAVLPVLDDMDRATDLFDKTDGVVFEKEGILLIFNKLQKILASKGLQAIETKGEGFDVDLHECITQIPAPDQQGKVVDELEKGYRLGEKVIRFSKVVVGQ